MYRLLNKISLRMVKKKKKIFSTPNNLTWIILLLKNSRYWFHFSSGPVNDAMTGPAGSSKRSMMECRYYVFSWSSFVMEKDIPIVVWNLANIESISKSLSVYIIFFFYSVVLKCLSLIFFIKNFKKMKYTCEILKNRVCNDENW